MNTTDREWLARIDERTINIWRAVENIEEHQIQQNGYVRDALIAIGKNTLWRKVMVGVGGTALVIIIGWLLNLTL